MVIVVGVSAFFVSCAIEGKAARPKIVIMLMNLNFIKWLLIGS
jgi:hypothetical protein